MPDPTAASTAAAAPPARTSWTGQVALRLLGRTGVRLGLCWVVLLALCAVFGPFLANSYPLAWTGGDLNTGAGAGAWSFPAFRYLQPSDGVLLVLTASLAATLALLRRHSVPRRVGLALLLTLAALPLLTWRVWLDAVQEHPFAHCFATLASTEHPTGLMPREQLAARALWAGTILGAPVWLALLAGGLWKARLSRVQWAVGLAMLLVLGGWLVPAPIRPPAKHTFEEVRLRMERNPEIRAVFAPVRYSPQDRQDDRTEVVGSEPPSWRHPLGTTTTKADVAGCMVHGCRVALAVGLISTGIAVVLGVVFGGLMGYFAGKVDLIGMRLVEVFSAIPVITILILVSVAWGRNIYLFMAILGLFGWVGYAIFTRAEFLRLREADYVQAARAVGAPTPWILFRHLVPNGITPIITLASFGVAGAVTTEAGLTFMGLGMPPDVPSWGQLLYDAREAVLAGTSAPGSRFEWWLLLYPTLSVFLTVFSYNLIGEGLRHALDPKNA